MALFKSGNPALREKVYEGTIFQDIATGQEMTIQGTMKKFGILMAMMLAATLFACDQFQKGSDPIPLFWTGVAGVFILSIVMAMKKEWSPYLAPAYGIVLGLFTGSISAYYDYAFKSKYPGLVMQAVGLTLIVAIVMFVLYYTRIIKVTQKFKSIVI